MKIYEMLQILGDEWKSLQKEFDVYDVDFYICRPSKMIVSMFKYTKGGNCAERLNNAVNDMVDNEKSEAVMFTKCIITKNEESKVVVDQVVIMEYGVLCELMYSCEDAMDTLIEYLRHSLRHEMGHVIVNRERYRDKDWDEAHSIMMNVLEKRKDVTLQREKVCDFKQFYYDYFNSYDEKPANDAVGITWERTWELDSVINRYRKEQL